VPEFILSILAVIRAFVRSRSATSLEILALRQQIAVLKRKRPRPGLNRLDRFFWTALRRAWSRWAEVLVVVKPETVIGWHRAGFRLYWRWRSRAARRPTQDRRRNSCSDPTLGAREPGLGSPFTASS
jgi:putative transposase